MHLAEGRGAHMEEQGDARDERDEEEARDEGRGVAVQKVRHDGVPLLVLPMRRARAPGSVAASQHYFGVGPHPHIGEGDGNALRPLPPAGEG